jgi:hypothetical protein
VEKIREEILRRVRDELLFTFYLKALEYHTRRGLRMWCNCEYCQARISGTRYIGHNTFYAYGTSYEHHGTWPSCVIPERKEHRQNYDYVKGYDNCVHQSFEDYICSGIERERERKRIKLRAELRELKEKVL